MACDIRRIIIDEGAIKRCGKAVDIGKEFTHFLTSVMKNEGRNGKTAMEKGKMSRNCSPQSFQFAACFEVPFL